jgi:enoyl-CoA hydratase/carnithine racemase
MIALDSLHLEVAGRVARLRLDHGKANEMGMVQLDDLERLVGWLEEAPVAALLTWSERVSGRGTPIFVSGANVTERQGWRDERVKAHVRRQRALLARLRAVPVFHACVVHGIAFGWGTEFLLACDYRIATPGARMALPETGLGILPGAGGSSELPRLVGMHQALRLGMTGEAIGAEEAARIGLVDEVQPDLAAALARAEGLASLVCRRSPTAVAAYKAAARAGGAEAEAEAYEHCVDSGEAAIGRAGFAAITAGEVVAWGPFRPWRR